VVFSLTYTYDYGDFVALVRAKRSLGRLGRFGVVTHFLVVGALYLALAAAGFAWDGVPLATLIERENLLMLLAGLLVAIVIVAVIDFVFLHWLYRLVFRRFALANREMTVTLDDDRIAWAATGFAGECAWSSVKWMVETKDRLFLFISKVEAIVLPRRATASDTEFQSMAAFVRKHVNG
jgi:YcxB-like protein